MAHPTARKWVSSPQFKWINPTYPIYNWRYNPLTKWDEPPSIPTAKAFVVHNPLVHDITIHNLYT
jgi:hypothetical protein